MKTQAKYPRALNGWLIEVKNDGQPYYQLTRGSEVRVIRGEWQAVCFTYTH